MPIPNLRLSKEPEKMSRTEARLAPTNELIVDPKLFMDMKRANRVPSIPGGQSCPDRIRKGMNLHSKMKLLVTSKRKTTPLFVPKWLRPESQMRF